MTRFLDPSKVKASSRRAFLWFSRRCPATSRQLASFSRWQRKEESPPGKAREHHAAIDILGRDIRRYTAAMFRPDMSPVEVDLLASLIEEDDFTASLGETLYQVARRVERQPFSPAGRERVDSILDADWRGAQWDFVTRRDGVGRKSRRGRGRQFLLETRERCLKAGARPAMGRARRDPRASGQRGTRLLPDRPHRGRASICAASDCRGGER